MNSRFPYTMLPFSFRRFNTDNFLLVNESGDYVFLDPNQFESLMSYELSKSEDIYNSLVSSHFISDTDIGLSVDMIATKYRTRKRFLNDFTGLHMMVITVRCNHRCEYCQVSSEAQEVHKYDMSIDTAKHIIDYIFKSPNNRIKIEFQGGEPILNWETVKAAIEYAEQINIIQNKHIEFVICTNLTLINEDQLRFLKDHGVSISTSLDGPREIHDKNRRMRLGGSSYDLFMNKLDLARNVYGNDISALMATTNDSLWSLDKVIDEYIRNDFPGIFLRTLNPYGFASENAGELGYSMADFVAAYKQALNYIIEKNRGGINFVEYYSTLLLTRILTPFSTGFVDLQSPAGTGISGVIYDYNGDIYPSDEARMLARMGDDHFKMGNVFQSPYLEIFTGDTLVNIVKNSCVETLPGCAWCVYHSYCGADPVRNYLECKDIVGHRPTSGFCKKHMGMFEVLFEKLRYGTEEEIDILWSWVTRRALKEVRCEAV